ncbi:hypothetical protein A4X09_0g3534 [Tilletia walkeri]|uniref:Uncharacterized protein n=1 Tax=Tilletia walkeri TaxID=117179 RepID=A0A8X7T5G3_9BASI|nr:hypothetical protein A4X09_0g3534 [Tilletia walkeri]
MPKDMPQCYFGLSGSYSLGSRILFYSCIASSVVALICRKLWQPGQRHRLDSVVAFSVSTTLMMGCIAALHMIVFGFIGMTTSHYRYVTDLDSIAADYFVRTGYAAAWVILILWPYGYSFRQYLMFGGVGMLFFASAASQTIINHSAGVATECLGSGLQACLAACSTYTAPLRSGSTPFPYTPQERSRADKVVDSLSQISFVIALTTAMATYFGTMLFCAPRSPNRFPAVRTGAAVVAGAILILSVVTGEIHLQHPPYSIGQEPLSSVGQWAAIASSAMIVFWSIAFLSFADVDDKQPNFRYQANPNLQSVQPEPDHNAPFVVPDPDPILESVRPEISSTEVLAALFRAANEEKLRQRLRSVPSTPLPPVQQSSTHGEDGDIGVGNVNNVDGGPSIMNDRTTTEEAEVTQQIPTGRSTVDTPAVDRT